MYILMHMSMQNNLERSTGCWLTMPLCLSLNTLDPQRNFFLGGIQFCFLLCIPLPIMRIKHDIKVLLIASPSFWFHFQFGQSVSLQSPYMAKSLMSVSKSSFN